MKRRYIKPETELQSVDIDRTLAGSIDTTPSYGAWLPDDYLGQNGGSTGGDGSGGNGGNVGWRDDEEIGGDDMFSKNFHFGGVWDE